MRDRWKLAKPFKMHRSSATSRSILQSALYGATLSQGFPFRDLPRCDLIRQNESVTVTFTPRRLAWLVWLLKIIFMTTRMIDGSERNWEGSFFYSQPLTSV